MKYRLAGPNIEDVVCRSGVEASQTQPMDVAQPEGPTRGDIARITEHGGEALILADRYRLLRRLGGGGMGAVYLAEQLDRGDRRVAVKILHASTHEWNPAVDRFLWEARLAARLRHPNVVAAHDFGATPTGVVFMAMELLEGRDLRAIVRPYPLSWRWAVYMMRQICAGLNALHRIGVVHRDLKTSNCFYVERSATVKIIDFGIATFEHDRARRSPVSTRTIIGTPESMAPEQIRGESVDRRSDIYAAGVLLYELLTGRAPFHGRTTDEVFRRQLEQPPPPLDVPCPPGFDALLRKALAKRADDRFQTIGEFAEALDNLADPREPEQPAFDEAPTLRRLVG
jgi:serine/threonine protein kinase